MAKVITDSTHYSRIADRVREKTNTADVMKPAELADKIDDVYKTAADGLGIPCTVSGENSVSLSYPNPTPHDIEVQLSSDTVNDFSGVSITACGKNMSPIESYPALTYAKAIPQLLEVLNKLPAGVYNLSFNIALTEKTESFSSTDKYGCIIVGITIGDWRTAWGDAEIGTTNEFSMRVTITQEQAGNISAVYFYGCGNDSVGKTGTADVTDIQLEEGRKRTEFEEYKGQTYTPNADGTLKVKSVKSPNMWLFSDSADISILCKHYKATDYQYHEFWDLYQDNGRRTDYGYAFAGTGWTRENFKPKYDISVANGLYLFTNSAIEGDLVELCDELGIKIDFASISNNQSLFQGCKFTRVGHIYCAGTMNYMFNNSSSLKTVDLISCNHSAGRIWSITGFQNCSALEDIRFDCTINCAFNLQWSANLTADSAKNIIEHLFDRTGTTTEGQATIKFPEEVWVRLNDTYSAPEGYADWQEYVGNGLGYLT